MKTNSDLSKVLSKKHDEKWVALSKDRTKVVDFADKLSKLIARTGERKDVTYMKVLSSEKEYAF